jgi:hypothetical protein
MKTFDVRKIYRSLERGDVKTIADAVGLQPTQVTRCLAQGYRHELRNEIIAAAMNVIKNRGDNPELIKEAQELGLASDSFLLNNRKMPSRFKKGNQFGRLKGRKKISSTVYVIGAVVVGFILFRKQITGLLDKVTA